MFVCVCVCVCVLFVFWGRGGVDARGIGEM